MEGKAKEGRGKEGRGKAISTWEMEKEKNDIGAREGGIGEHVGKEQKILTDQSYLNISTVQYNEKGRTAIGGQ